MSRYSKYFSKGETQTPDEFLKAFTEAAGGRFYEGTRLRVTGLTDGAIKAFHEGRAENLQTLLQNINKVEFRNYGHDRSYEIHKMLEAVAKPEDDKGAAIARAVEKISEPDRRKLLNGSLLYSVVFKSETSYIEALLDAGAKPSDITLIEAVVSGSLPAVRALYDRGARFDKAISYMKSEGNYSQDVINSVKRYQLMIEGVPDSQKSATANDITQLREQVAAMAEQIGVLTSVVRQLAENVMPDAAPEPLPPPRERKPYPRL